MYFYSLYLLLFNEYILSIPQNHVSFLLRRRTQAWLKQRREIENKHFFILLGFFFLFCSLSLFVFVSSPNFYLCSSFAYRRATQQPRTTTASTSSCRLPCVAFGVLVFCYLRCVANYTLSCVWFFFFVLSVQSMRGGNHFLTSRLRLRVGKGRAKASLCWVHIKLIS